MADKKLVEYIKTNLSRGSSMGEIEKKLLSAGFSESDIEGAMDYISDEPEGSGKASGRMWLVIILLTLIAGVSAIIGLSFMLFGGFSLMDGSAPIGSGECDAKPEGVYRALCYTDLAKAGSGASACDNLMNTEEGKYRDICIRDFAVWKLNSSACALIENAYIKEQCTARIMDKTG